VDEILNITSAPKKSPSCLLIHMMSLSLSPPRLFTCFGPLLSLSRSALHLVLSSLSISIGDCSDDHPVPRLRSDRVLPRRLLRRPPLAVRRHGSALTTTQRPGDRNDDEEALWWAALERLPTHPALRQGLPLGLLPQVLAQPPISRAHHPRLLPRLRARRRAHHWRKGTMTLLASRGSMTLPPPSMPS
jgi:hypothetical protein